MLSPVILAPRSQKNTGAEELARPRILDAPVCGLGTGEWEVEVDDTVTATAELNETSSVTRSDNIAMEDVRATRI